MSLIIVDNPTDRPAWIQETIRLLTAGATEGRRALLHLVEDTTDADLVHGTPDDWGIGQIAVHLLIVERGVSLIALRLARGEQAGNTGQPRPAPGAVTRDGIRSLADKAATAAQRLGTEFPPEPDATKTADHPFLRPLRSEGPDRRSWVR
ncbi:MAG: hypothetical protein M3O64_01480 [Chloroflexota bacterium]|nr:hypothetical protein [Chloroflexota bacterium]